MATLTEFVKTPLAMPLDFGERLGVRSRWKAGLIFLLGQWIGLFVPAAFLLPAVAHRLNALLILAIVLPLMALGVQARGLFYFWVARRNAPAA